MSPLPWLNQSRVMNWIQAAASMFRLDPWTEELTEIDQRVYGRRVWHQAKTHLDLAESTLREVGTAADQAYVLTERARLALLQGKPDEAVSHADAALAAASDDELEVARCLFLKGRALSALDLRDGARTSLGAAAETFRRLGARQQEAACWREIGEMDVAAGDSEAALVALREGLTALDPQRSRA